MLRWALIFFIVAVIAAIFGFGGLVAGAVTVAKILFFIFVLIFLVLFIAGLAARSGAGQSEHPVSHHRPRR